MNKVTGKAIMSQLVNLLLTTPASPIAGLIETLTILLQLHFLANEPEKVFKR